MKKAKLVQVSAASMLALSAITPVVAFANETTETTPEGFYVAGKFISTENFQKLSKKEKKELILSGVKNGAIVLVQDGKVFDLTNTAIQDAKADEVEALAVTVEEYTETTGNTLSPEKGLEGDGVVKPDPIDEELVVESVSAITTTAVEINIKALTEDNATLEVEVKDGKSNVVATKPVAVSAGETTITVEFVTEVKTADLVGVWTVNGKEFNLDVANQLEAILTATSELALYNALEAASIKNIDVNLITSYFDAIGDADEVTSLEAVQAIIDEVNADNLSAGEAVKVVKEVYSATNEVTYSKALTGNFKRVNTEWVSDYDTAIDAVFTAGAISDADNIIESNATELLEDIQEAIDAVNLVKVITEWAAVESSIDTSKFAAVKTLINTYKVAAEEGKVNEYDYLLDVLDYQTAIATATTASTNSALLSALTKVDTLLDQNTEKYAGKTFTVASSSITGFKNEADYFDIKFVKSDSASLTAYRAAIKAVGDADDKNQAKDLEKIITDANDIKVGTLLDAVIAADVAFVSGTVSTEKALLDAIKAVVAYEPTAFEDVEVVDSRVAGYATAITTLADTTALKTALTTANTDATDTAYDAIFGAADAAALLAALKSAELALTGVTDANAAQYYAEVTDFKAATEVSELNTLIKKVNALVAINKATTASAVQAQLSTFGVDEYLDVQTPDRGIVAEVILNARNTESGKVFADISHVEDVIEDVSVTVVGALLGLNMSSYDFSASELASLFKVLGLNGFDATTETISIEEADLAQAFLNSLVLDPTSGYTTPKFKSLTEINTVLAGL